MKRTIPFIVAALLLCTLCLTFTACNKQEEPREVEFILDARKYSHITPEDVIAEFGEPRETEDWIVTGIDRTEAYPATAYYYDFEGGATLEFNIIDGAVVRLNYFAPAETGKKYEALADVIKSFGLSEKDGTITKDSNAVKSYEMNLDDVKRFAIWEITMETKTFDRVRIDYDTKYFR